MTFELFLTIVVAANAFLTVVALVMSWGKKSGVTDTKLREFEIKFDTLHAKQLLDERTVQEAMSRLQDKITDALLGMARDHPTNADLHATENRIIDRLSEKIDLLLTINGTGKSIVRRNRD